MDFFRVITEVFNRLDQAGVSYALIGGFAMAMRGVQRATVDLDLILVREHLDQADTIFHEFGYQRFFRSENVSHYRSEETELGRIDILHAFRGPSLSMLERADRLELSSGITVPVVQVEDIVGLKIQSAYNDQDRREQDWLDIRMLMQTSAERNESMDWTLITDYLEIFGMRERLRDLEHWHGSTD